MTGGARLRHHGLEVGELVTSLDMGGCSVTATWLDDELARLWRADVYTPAYRRVAAPVRALRAPTDDERTEEAAVVATPEATARPGGWPDGSARR